MEREGVYGHITQLEFPLGFVTLDKDLISLEISDFYESFFLVCGNGVKILSQAVYYYEAVFMMKQLLSILLLFFVLQFFEYNIISPPIRKLI